MAQKEIVIKILEIESEPTLPLLSPEEMEMPISQLLGMASAKLRRHEFEELPGPQALHRREELKNRHNKRHEERKPRRSGSARKNGRVLKRNFLDQDSPF